VDFYPYTIRPCLKEVDLKWWIVVFPFVIALEAKYHFKKVLQRTDKAPSDENSSEQRGIILWRVNGIR
jgi:hypothetical protein